ncbi:MAG: glycosyltransferase family 4 protein [Promethearchaeota archaeon]
MAHVPPRYFPAISGAEFYFQRISEILNEKYNINVYCTDALDFQAFRDIKGKRYTLNKLPESINNIPVYRFKITYDSNEILKEKQGLESDVIGRLNCDNILKLGPFSKELGTCLDRIEVNIFHTTFFPYCNILYALKSALKKKIPCVVTPFIHISNPRYLIDDLTILNKFSRILVCTNQEGEFLKNFGIDPLKIKRITMGVDLKPFENVNITPFIKRFNVDPRSSNLVLFCGYKNYEKGALTVLKSIPLILEKNDSVFFIFIGPATRQFNIELKKIRQYKDKVINLGPSNLSGYFDKIKLSAFNCCDVFTMPSRSDAFGIAFLEAWACKKPVISADTPAMREIFQDGREGFQIPFNNHEKLADRILYLLENKKERLKMGSNGYNKIINEKLTWQHVAEKISEIYENEIKANA